MDGIPHGGCNWEGCKTCFPNPAPAIPEGFNEFDVKTAYLMNEMYDKGRASVKGSN